jgi:hypothetical protein
MVTMNDRIIRLVQSGLIFSTSMLGDDDDPVFSVHIADGKRGHERVSTEYDWSHNRNASTTIEAAVVQAEAYLATRDDSSAQDVEAALAVEIAEKD